MAKRFCFLLLIILLKCFPAYAQQFLGNLPNQKPVQILSDDNGRFYIDYSDSIIVYSDKVEYILNPADPDSQYDGYSFESVVTKKGVVYTLIESSIPHNSDTIYNHFTLATYVGEKCTNKKLASWSIDTNLKKNITVYDRSPLYLSRNDMLFFTIEKYHSGKKSYSKTFYYINGEETDGLRYSRLFKEHFPAPSSGVKIKGKVPFSTNGREETLLDQLIEKYNPKIVFKKKYPFISFQKPEKTSFDRSIVWDNKEYPHIFFHNKKDRSFYHRFYSTKEKKNINIKIDGTESGQVNAAFLSGNKIWTIHYFYRDPFNKGLLVSVHNSDTGEVLRQFVLDASKNRNSGWDLVGGKSSSGKLLFTYLSNVRKNRREYVLLDKVDDLDILGSNFKKYGTPKGKGYLKLTTSDEKINPSENLSNSHLKDYRNYKIDFEMGLQYVFWDFDVPVPDSSSFANHYRLEYELSETLLNFYKIKAKLGRINVGFNTGINLLNDDFDGDGFQEDYSEGNWKASLGFDQFLFYCDVKLELERRRTTVFFKDKSHQVASRYFDLNFEETKLTFTTFKRLNCGLIYQKYNFFQPVYVYFSPHGLDYYEYDFQAIGDIDVKNYLVFLGFSTYNYIEKYETEYKDWFLNVEGYWGQTRGKFKNIVHTTGTTNMEKEDDIYVFGADLEFGWMWYKKFESLNQLGIQLKVSYQIQFTKTGNSDKPDSDEDILFSDDYYYSYERSELRHGPLFSLSFNF